MTSCWGIATSAGMEAQVRALAEALGAKLEMKNLRVKQPFVWLPNACYAGGLAPLVIPYLLASGHDVAEAPWPELVISCGRRAAISAMGLKARMKNDATRFIHIQDPYVNPKHFDLVVAMEHDRITGSNVIKTRYALHNITQEKLDTAAAQFAGRFAKFHKPHVAVLLGGSTNKYVLTSSAMKTLISDLRSIVRSISGSLLITTSRRTGAGNISLLREALAYELRVFLYDGTGENPYMGMLGAADAIIVTNDSVNMMSEAAATGKPLYILPLPGHENTKPARFAERLMADGVARLFTGNVENWSYESVNEMPALAADIRQRLTLP